MAVAKKKAPGRPAKGLESVEFFGAADRGKSGKLTSMMPGWCFPNAISELELSINQREKALEMGVIPRDKISYEENKLKRDKKRKMEILNAKPTLSAGQKDELSKLYELMKGQIRDSMFSRSDMKKGLADPHEEARRMKTPGISVQGFEAVAKKMGIPVPRSGKISRDEASRIYKMSGRLLGEQTNTEHLRRDYNYGTVQLDKTLDELIGPD